MTVFLCVIGGIAAVVTMLLLAAAGDATRDEEEAAAQKLERETSRERYRGEYLRDKA